MNVADLRRNYTMGGLSETEAGPEPLPLFRTWLEAAIAAKLNEPNAMTLATVTDRGRPAARTVLLKGYDERGFTFFTNYDSRKAHEILANPFAALVFLWDELERQVRIEGTVSQISREESAAYFQTRPLGSKLGAWASPQSAIIPNREFLEEQHAALMAQHPTGEIPLPPQWGGYRVLPELVEFWQGRTSRLHDRIQFRASANGWIRERLAP